MAKVATLDEVLAEVAFQGVRIDSIGERIEALEAKAAEERAKAERTPEDVAKDDQAKIDKALAGLRENHEKLETVIASFPA